MKADLASESMIGQPLADRFIIFMVKKAVFKCTQYFMFLSPHPNAFALPNTVFLGFFFTLFLET